MCVYIYIYQFRHDCNRFKPSGRMSSYACPCMYIYTTCINGWGFWGCARPIGLVVGIHQPGSPWGRGFWKCTHSFAQVPCTCASDVCMHVYYKWNAYVTNYKWHVYIALDYEYDGHVCVYVQIYIYYIYIIIYIIVHIYIYTYIYIQSYMYVCIYIYMHTHHSRLLTNYCTIDFCLPCGTAKGIAFSSRNGRGWGHSGGSRNHKVRNRKWSRFNTFYRYSKSSTNGSFSIAIWNYQRVNG